MEEGERREIIIPGIYRPVRSNAHSAGLVEAFGTEAVAVLEAVKDPASGISVANAGLIEALSLTPEAVTLSLAVASESASGFLALADEVRRVMTPLCRKYGELFLVGGASPKVRVEPVFEFDWSMARFPNSVFWAVFVRGGVRHLPDGLYLSSQEIALELERRVRIRKREESHVS